ncbi:MAG: ATP-binding protein [Bacteroidales bacterium]|nr:ATP-binding protein [Bacteroidales bacterium]
MKHLIDSIKHYNFWDSNTIELGYLRNLYTKKISDFIGNKLIKVLVGQRRVGKSYILRQIANDIIQSGIPAENTLYINMEFYEYESITNANDLNLLVKEYENHFSPKGTIYLFIDEIQNIKEWEKMINSFSQDFTKNYEIFITGSNSNLLSGELASYLSGRYIQFNIYPYSFHEFCSVFSLRENKQSYISYLESGGLPELSNLLNKETKRNYILAIKNTVLLRDIIQRHTIKDAQLLEDIFKYLIMNASNLISITSIVNFFKSKQRITNYETVANYIKYIEDAFLIHKTERYSIKGKNTIAGIFKYYINDVSFANYIYPGLHQGIGYKLENLVFLELKRAGYEIYIGIVKNKEVDFMAMKTDKVLYLQSTYLLSENTTIDREYSALESIRDNYEKYVVSLDDVQFPSRDGIKHIQAWKLTEIL